MGLSLSDGSGAFSCTKVGSTTGSNVDASALKGGNSSCMVRFIANQPRLGWLREITKARTISSQLVPPHIQIINLSNSCCIVCIPDLLRVTL